MKKKMSNYVNNLNELINTKKELKDIIIESTGENPSEVFSYYPSYIRNAIASSGASEEAVNSYISAYLSAYNYIDQDTLSSNSYLTQHQDLSSYATKSYVVDYVATYAPTPDLSSYVTKTELSACGYITSIPSEYITQTELSACGYITINDVPASPDLTSYVTKTELSAQSYLTSHQDLSGYVSKTELSSCGYITINDVPSTDLSGYVSKTELSAQSYITMGDVSACGYLTSIPTEYITQTELSSCGYITLSDVPSSDVVDENLIPKESLTYTLGDASHLYDAAYTNNIKGNDSIKLSINNTDKYTFANGFFAPTSNSGQNLGHKNYYWSHSYISNIFGGTLFSSNNTNTKLIFTNLNTIRLYANNAIYNLEYDNFSPDNDKSKNLGTSSKSWLSTYTKNLYLNGTNLEDRFTSLLTQSDIDNMSYITMGDVSACGYITINDVPAPDLSGYVTKTELSSQSYLTSIPSEYITQVELSSCGYITESDVAQMGYITANDVDLSDYVSYDYADENYVSYSYLGDLEEITEYILGSGSGSAPENIYATKSELNSYVSKTSLQSMAYITMDDIDACGYITASDIPAAPDLSSYVTKTELSNQSYLTSIPSEYITQNELSACGYITINDVPAAPDLSSYVTKAQLSAQSYLTSIPSEYVTQTELSANSYITSSVSNLNNYYTKTQINNQSYITSAKLSSCGYITTGIFSFDSNTNTLTITTV